MGKVTYDQAGYYGSSMSERAREAYESGAMPRSKWTKAVMLAALQEWCEENGRVLNEDVEKMRKDDLWSRLFEWKSWHHTGISANKTDFYGIDEDAAEEASRPMTEAEAEAEEAERKARLMAHEAEEAAHKAREWQRFAEKKREIAEFERIAGISYYSLHGFIAWRERRGQEVSIRLAKSGALIVGFDGSEYNLSDRSHLRPFLRQAFAIFSSNAKFDATYERVTAEVEEMRAQLAEQVTA